MDVQATAQLVTGQDRITTAKVADTQGQVTSSGNKVDVEQEKSYTKAELNKELSHLNKWLESKDSHLQFVLHEKLNEYYVQIVNDQTNEVIREIPSKKIMDIVANFYEKLGFIMDKKI